MTIIQKLRQLYPNHHHRVQPKPNIAFQTAGETIYQCHIRNKELDKDDFAWDLVAEGLHNEVHSILDGLMKAQDHARLKEALRTDSTPLTQMPPGWSNV
jgi:hypothetical protein